jgi:hypothetical protein
MTIGSISLILFVMAGAASAESVFFRGTLEESFHPTAIDSNADGESANFGVGQGRSTLGPITREGWVEVFPWDGATFCGPTHVQINYRFAESSFRFKDGSRVFAVFSSGTLCFNFATGTFTASGEIEVIGGTGRFEGATGTLRFEANAPIAFPNGLTVLEETFEGRLTVSSRESR